MKNSDRPPVERPNSRFPLPGHGTLADAGRAAIYLVPKLRLGTHVFEAPLRPMCFDIQSCWRKSHHWQDRDIMKWNPTKLPPVVLACCGVLSPLAVGILSIIVMDDKLRDKNFYASGGVATWEAVTSLLIIITMMLGWILCWPWLKYARRPLLTRSIAICVGAILIQYFATFIIVFSLSIKAKGFFP